MVDLLGHLKSPIGINVGTALCVYMKSLWETRPRLRLHAIGPPLIQDHPAAGQNINMSEHVAVMQLKPRLGFCIDSL